ncbi:MAG TPA: glucose-6-phosphate dehydrogenase assembly protein OpcA [Solirubrobacteraceae bacterium]|jgi:glucose-6-phosphate dehydrogenase assembly protein OpcA|nr:glucose-6-phosphate dehydrogenase assembly protein OpcA [Solirubrobacteraceae bacterium]
MSTIDAVWNERDTSPGAIEEALRRLVSECHASMKACVPARTLNLVCVVDREWSGEIANRLRRVGRYHASRTVVCAVEPRRTTIDAQATVSVEGDARSGEFAAMRELVIVSLGERHLADLDTIVDPLVVTDLRTAVWAPHGHPEAVDALTTGRTGGAPIAQVVLTDSVDEPDPRPGLARECELAGRSEVVDLAWLRCTPWRERLAAAYDPPQRRGELQKLSKISVRYGHDSLVSGLLLVGWLCTQLGWRPDALTRHGTLLRGRARARRGEVELRLEPFEGMAVPGLAGVETRSDNGALLALERGEGGLTARRREPPTLGHDDVYEHVWTVLGASRGEPGILGEGIRHALMHDPTFNSALDAARRLLG